MGVVTEWRKLPLVLELHSSFRFPEESLQIWPQLPKTIDKGVHKKCSSLQTIEQNNEYLILFGRRLDKRSFPLTGQFLAHLRGNDPVGKQPMVTIATNKQTHLSAAKRLDFGHNELKMDYRTCLSLDTDVDVSSSL